MSFKKDLNIDQNMIRKMAEELAKGKVNQIFTSGGDTEKKAYEEDYATSRKQANLTNENMRAVLARSQTVVCEKCNNYTFSQSIIVKRVSPFISPTGEEMMVPVQALSCAKCNHINKQFLPEDAISDVLEKEEKPKPKRKRKATVKKKA